MEFYLAEKTDNSVTIKFKGTDTTLVDPVMDVLNRNKDVKIVRYINTHPELEDPALYVETIKGSPIDAIRAAAEEVSAYFSS